MAVLGERNPYCRSSDRHESRWAGRRDSLGPVEHLPNLPDDVGCVVAWMNLH